MKYVLLGLVFISGLSSCRKMKDPVFQQIENVRMNSLSFSAPEIMLDIRYMNPNSFNARLSRAEGDAWVDSLYLGHFVVDSSVNILAKQEFLVPVKLIFDKKNLLKHSMRLAMNQDPVMLRITGSARAGRGGVYKNFPLSWSGKQDLSKLLP